MTPGFPEDPFPKVLRPELLELQVLPVFEPQEARPKLLLGRVPESPKEDLHRPRRLAVR